MSTTSEQSVDGTGKSPSPEQLEADIERTRDDLASTVDALTAKFDLRTKAKARAAAAKTRAQEMTGRAKHVAQDDKQKAAIPIGAIALVAVVVGVVIWKRR